MYKDISFFNQESTQYSQKRYPRVASNYLQFFFLRRLAITKNYIKHIIAKRGEPLTLLEIGCADGVILRTIAKEFPTTFSKLIGVDVAAEMVEQARRQNIFSNTEFLTRDKYHNQPPLDVIVETGVINYTSFEEEIAFVKKHLKPDGFYIFSIAGTESLRNRIKGEGELSDFRSYKEYDRLIREDFIVEAVEGCGLFIPLLWRVPFIARAVQAVVDPIAGNLFPSLCHEKMYLVKKK